MGLRVVTQSMWSHCHSGPKTCTGVVRSRARDALGSGGLKWFAQVCPDRCAKMLGPLWLYRGFGF